MKVLMTVWRIVLMYCIGYTLGSLALELWWRHQKMQRRRLRQRIARNERELEQLCNALTWRQINETLKEMGV